MTQIEKILAEIERLKKELYKQQDFRIDGSPIPVFDTNAIDGMLKILEEIKKFINTLPSEQQSEDLEKAATALTNEIVGELNLGDYTDHSGHNAHWHSFKEGVVAGVQWYKDQMMKSAVSIGYLQGWYQNSIDGEVPPIWTDEHLNELTKDFYLIPKQKEDKQ